MKGFDILKKKKKKKDKPPIAVGSVQQSDIRTTLAKQTFSYIAVVQKQQTPDPDSFGLN